MSTISLKGIHKYYGNAHILKDVNLEIADGDFMTLLGPSGCGKTTTLRLISGLENPQQGIISIDGSEVANGEDKLFFPPAKRGLDLVFQSYALWPHMTVFDNVAFGLQLKKLPKKEIFQKVHHALKRMHIDEYSDRYPNELSGGQQQRVAIARAIVSETKILLLDEPLSNLDAKLRIEMRSEIKRLHKELGTTVIYVTHDQTEALTMSTKIALFFDGVLVQCDKPMDVYRNPANVQIADFIGNPKINFIDCNIVESNGDAIELACSFGSVRLKNVADRKRTLTEHSVVYVEPQERGLLALRPEHITMYETPADVVEDIKVVAMVYSDMPAGSETLVQLQLEDGSFLMAKCIGERTFETNQLLYLGIDSGHLNLFDKDSGQVVLGMDYA